MFYRYIKEDTFFGFHSVDSVKFRHRFMSPTIIVTIVTSILNGREGKVIILSWIGLLLVLASYVSKHWISISVTERNNGVASRCLSQVSNWKLSFSFVGHNQSKKKNNILDSPKVIKKMNKSSLAWIFVQMIDFFFLGDNNYATTHKTSLKLKMAIG